MLHDSVSGLRLNDGLFVKLYPKFRAWRYVFGLARRGSAIGFHLLRHTVELVMSTLLCLS